VVEGAAGRTPAAGAAVAQAADGQGTGTVVRERRDELLQQPLEGRALARLQYGDQLVERVRSPGQDVCGGPVPLRGQAKRTDATIGARTPLDEPVDGQAVGDPDGRRLRDAQHVRQALNRFVRMSIQVHERARMRAAPAHNALHGRARPIRARQREDSEQLRETIRHP
jgi:hypothetical protein